MSFESITKTRKRLVAVMLALLLVGGVTGFYVSQISFPRIIRPALAQGFRDYTLEVKPADIVVAEGVTWHAWTYNGTVPGPTLKAKVGEILRVTVFNKDTTNNLKHSFHTHIAPYNFTSDGSQANVIYDSVIPGAGSMIPPNDFWLYEFQLTQAGLFYYHCHSSDGGHPINEHMLRGLYGAIVVDEPEAPQYRDIPIFMAERAGPVDPPGSPVATFVLNGLGIPGGEMTLEEIFATGDLPAVVAEFNRTVLAYSTPVGSAIRLHIVNIGNLDHSFHLHGINMVSQWYFPGRIWPANVVQLVPGAADSVVITPQYPGLWLFHCHVVFHADAGMIGVLQVV